ncbi:hypothetical protein M427DRAFT_205321 [Gonapodya prolifera JEL478]|uniref:Homeobox domain-containing protein n=1 Tax=Gonapodya prolifera (strain JEL478) TaxID=1344416 RepID=A0A138ZZE6_GONPJ|nr:hypothetical protein M427DRAFT_205321 [Gonapodya prolifera JEL478]|eukprot:KXS09879.1 hypothetical protein M427DRAFT_205321 [Gonapodya prolifera JEL478]
MASSNALHNWRSIGEPDSLMKFAQRVLALRIVPLGRTDALTLTLIKQGRPKEALEVQYLQNPTPASAVKMQLALELHVSPQNIGRWFSARRRRDEGQARATRKEHSQVIVLADFFSVNPFPSQPEKEELARATGLTYKQVNSWFQNQRKKNGMTNLNNLPSDRLQFWHQHVAEHIRVAEERRSTSGPSASPDAETRDGIGTNALPPLPPTSENQITLPAWSGVSENELIVDRRSSGTLGMGDSAPGAPVPNVRSGPSPNIITRSVQNLRDPSPGVPEPRFNPNNQELRESWPMRDQHAGPVARTTLPETAPPSRGLGVSLAPPSVPAGYRQLGAETLQNLRVNSAVIPPLSAGAQSSIRQAIGPQSGGWESRTQRYLVYTV